LADAFARAWGGDAAWHLSETVHPHEASYLKVDASKARAALGWDRRLSLATALDWTARWYRDESEGAPANDLISRQINAYEALGDSR
ncbi:MAG: CDP-glucose 4,6-dehydratase, partial [Methylobacteriaceae bacterium]